MDEVLQSLFAILESIPDEKLREVKKYVTEKLKKPTKKVALTRDQKLVLVREKMDSNNHSYNYHEICYVFELLCRDMGYSYTANTKNDTIFIKRAFPNIKSKEGFGENHYLVLKKYIEVYDRLFKSESFPSPTIQGLGQNWIINKVVDLVCIDARNNVKVSDITEEVY